MLKFENRVALNKINRFIETSALVIFFHCKCSALEQKQKNISRILNKKPILYKQLSFNRGDEDFQVKAIKNKYLKKALFKKPNLEQSNSTLSLTQGTYLVISLKEKTFFLLKDLIEDDTICLLGAIYKNRCTDHNRLSDLAKIIENDSIYHSSSAILKNRSFLLPSLLYNARSNLSWISNNSRAKLYFTICFLRKKVFCKENKTVEKAVQSDIFFEKQNIDSFI